jgi:uncharacterized protein
MTIVVAGGSGFIGTQLVKALLDKKHTVIVVDKKAPLFTHEQLFFINCDLSSQQLPYNVLDRTDAVINLTGSFVAKKWTLEVKEEIQKSRIESTKRIVESIKNAESRPTVFVNASAIGFYGETKEEVDEQGEMGKGFLAEVVAHWEAEAREAVNLGVRVVCVRTAPVLAKFLSPIIKTRQFGFLLKPSKKDFWMSWIHQADIVAVYLFALETNTLQGVVNASSPEPVLQSTFFTTLGKVLHKKILGVIPRFILKFRYGQELIDEFEKSQQVLPKRLLDKGFIFSFPTLKEALIDTYKNETK